jgi:hypothetical protein
MKWGKIKEVIDESLDDDAEMEAIVIKCGKEDIDVQLGFEGCFKMEPNIIDAEYTDCLKN